jgi:hydroxymethylpyrimidine/phosphomethylpyrimidine kinase
MPQLVPVLTVAGSDSGGGAGIQADLKTFHRFGTFGMSVITAITAQNTRGVSGWQAVDPALVRDQLTAVVTDLPPAALKSGMLANERVIMELRDCIHSNSLHPYVLDPVMVATSGHRLLDGNAVHAMRHGLLPLAAVVTPNLHEAGILLGKEVRSVARMRDAARFLVDEGGAGAALVKGGHLENDEAVDILFDGDFRVFTHPRLETTSTHGTGCTLSAAIAANLALGAPVPGAVEIALEYVHRAILLAPGIGGGHGPLNHFA